MDDICIDYHFLKGDDADYSGIARCYRKYQLDRGAYDFCSRTCELALAVQWCKPFDIITNRGV